MAEVVTGEAVVLDLAVARFPSRMVALMLDGLVQIAVYVLLVVVVFTKAAAHLNTASAAAVFVAGYVMIFVGYPVIFETLSRGKTLGKLALGLRVVSDDGGPIRFRQALIRGLFSVFLEIWLLPFIGLLASMFSVRGKRLGDQVAGTFVIQERVPRRAELPRELAVVPPFLVGWAVNLELSRLSDQTAAAASSYLRRYYELTPQAREAIGNQLANAVAGQVSPPPPPGIPAAAYLSAVLAVRRDREWARMAARRGDLPGPVGQAYPVPPGFPGARLNPMPGPRPDPLPQAGQTSPTVPAETPAPSGLAEASPPSEPDALGFIAPT